jgi:hypothetical protein
LEEGVALHLASSTVSGFVVCCAMHPPNTVMSRMYNQTSDKYKSAVDCLMKTVRSEGVLQYTRAYLFYLFDSRDNAIHPQGICGLGNTKEKVQWPALGRSTTT